MIIDGYKFNFENTLDSSITVPDCFVKAGSKLGKGNGESKLYVGSKKIMYDFFGNDGFYAKCFVLKVGGKRMVARTGGGRYEKRVASLPPYSEYTRIY